jgi:curved DNA-binding protein CbpA
MEAATRAQPVPNETIYCGSIKQVRPANAGAAECVLSQGAPILVPASLAAYLGSGDEIEVPITLSQAGVEIHVRKNPASRRLRELYQAPIGYAAQPKADKRGELFVAAAVTGSRLAIRSIHLPCAIVRDYFYVADRRRESGTQSTLYEIVRMPQNAGPSELRLSFKIRQLELQKEGAPEGAFKALERAYNMLANPETRACYDALLNDPDAPVVFPYGGFGSLLVSGDRPRDGQTFFAKRILVFRPEMHDRRFRAPLRRFEFYPATAIYRDARRKLELMVDQAAMPVVWNQTWNQWKHLLAAKVQIDATFVRAGKYRMKSGEWRLVEWESALPSRLTVNLPASVQEQLDAARKTYHRFGQHSRAFDQIRARIEREPVEKRELERLLGQYGVPGDFDVAQLNWQPEYDPFFYQQLAKRARRLYLFREEYIFDLVTGVAVETPQLGHATYLFAQPASMEAFLALYTRVTKDDIRTNRDNVAERLGFLGRIVHGANPRAWNHQLRSKLGEPVDYAAAAEV